MESKEIFKYVLNLRKKDSFVNWLFFDRLIKIDIQKTIELDDAFEIINLQTMINEKLDGSPSYILIMAEDKCLFIIGRPDPREMESEYFDESFLLQSFREEVKDVSDLLKLLKKIPETSYTIVSINNFIEKKSKSYQQIPVDQNYQFEKRVEIRKEKLSVINMLKSVNSVFNNYTDLNPENQDEILAWTHDKILQLNKYLNDIGMCHIIKKMNSKIVDFEYDMQRNRLYIDFRFQIVIETDEKDVIDKYITISPSVRGFVSKNLSSQIRKDILAATLLKTLMGYFGNFTKTFKDKSLPLWMNNFNNNGFQESMVNKFAPNLTKFNYFITRK